MHHKVHEWKHHLVVQADADYKMTYSGSWEYTIFNLIFVYRTFDFDKDMLVLYGG
jgi:hypothetical protein